MNLTTRTLWLPDAEQQQRTAIVVAKIAFEGGIPQILRAPYEWAATAYVTICAVAPKAPEELDDEDFSALVGSVLEKMLE